MKIPSLLLILVLFLGACGQSSTNSLTDPDSASVDDNSNESVLDIFTTAYPLAYFTERIGQDLVNVASIYPPGANEHTFEPTQQDMIALAEADLLFYVGLGLEGFISDAQQSLNNENVKFVSTASAISEQELVTEDTPEGEADDHGQDEEEHEAEQQSGDASSAVDPHVWISPVLSQKLAQSIKDSLIKIDPEGAMLYETNYASLINELEQLDQSFIDLANQIENKTFFVSHAAFGYIAETYGFEQVAVAGLNSQDEPSQKELTAIVELAKEKGINHIVFEQNVSSELAEIVQQEIGAEAVEMHNLGVLTEEDIENGETYFTLMEKNRDVLKTILQ
ncbi:metal ABC transporter solute-binding protein, Zn/Mn family [Planococcus lenghuensis]|uniref:Adhesin n=1 Tax=Planococcus lenghuensis TaxID=2213202 RepID=A0A1Q2L5U4_9BACL|nr:zinc ABC transporter substrate-binding protein [Planococcus lenghuensis]AQQ55292.1 adhesin [Planococcus lenghuensis]